jgi:hypothetical protein
MSTNISAGKILNLAQKELVKIPEDERIAAEMSYIDAVMALRESCRCASL